MVSVGVSADYILFVGGLGLVSHEAEISVLEFIMCEETSVYEDFWRLGEFLMIRMTRDHQKDS